VSRFVETAASLTLGLSLVLLAGCRMDMHDQPKIKPYDASSFFADGRGARPLPAGTVARGRLDVDSWFYEGKTATGDLVALLPAPVSRADLERGRQRYDIYCSPCHDRTGGGNGMIVQRGYVQPTSFHADRLRSAPVGYFFNAITKGFGVMPSYAKQVPVADRWAIVAYIKALQLSQNARIGDVPPDALALLDGQGEGEPASADASHGDAHE
jgi:mono/diheme cytochrome c family protein